MLRDCDILKVSFRKGVVSSGMKGSRHKNGMVLRSFVTVLFLVSTILSYGQTARYWVGGDGNWSDNTNHWSATSGGAPGASVPNSNTFLVIFDANSGSPHVNVNIASFSLQQLWVNANVALIASGGNRTITVGDGTNNSISGASVSNADLVVESGDTLAITGGTNTLTLTQNNNANSQASILGTVLVNTNAAFTKATSPSLSFLAGSSYIHNRDGGTVTTATWDVASNCIITGITSTAPSGLNQTFGNLTWNCTSQAGTISLNTSSTVNGTFRIQSTNGQTLLLTDNNTTSYTFTVNNFRQDGGIFSLSNRDNRTGTLNVSGSFYLASGATITKSGANAGNVITFTGSTDADLTSSLNGIINSTGTNPILFNIAKTAPAKVIMSSYEFDATAELRITSGTLSFGTSPCTVITNGNFRILAAGTLDMSGNTDHAFYLRGATNAYTAGATFTAGTGNQVVAYDGDVNQTVMPVTYRNLAIGNYNSSSTTARTKTLTAASTTTVSGNLSVDGYAASLTTLQLTSGTLTVNGLTNINAYGVLNDNSNTGTNTLVGLVTVNPNGQWISANTTPNNSFIFQGGLVFNGSVFSTSTGYYVFNTNNQSISGTQSLSITNVVTSGITLTNENTAGLTVNTISGTGNFTNGDASNNAILYLTGAGDPLTLTGTVDFASNPNTVNYFANTAQTIKALNFYNLTISGARANTSVTLVNGGTIGVANAFSPVATFTTGNYIRTNNTIDFNGTAAQDMPAFTFNNLTISGGSIKSMQGAVTVAGILVLNNGILQLGDNNLTLSSSLATAIQGTFDSNNMIATDGAGYLIKNANSAQPLYPFGSGGYYSPMTISSITPTTGTLSARAVPVAINPSYIQKYWDIASSVTRTSVTATFQYDAAEANGASPSISYSPDGGTTWQNPPSSGTSSFGTNSFTITGTTPFAGWWTMGYRTYYSYQTGNWNSPSTWTSDPSGTLQLGSTIPGYNDNVVILNGRTVSLSENITTQNLSISINSGGILDLSTYQFTNNLLSLSGQGTLKLASTNFPSATTNTFINAGGGTTEYNIGLSLPASPSMYNNLTINTSGTVVQVTDLTLNGNLYVQNGTYQINDNSAARRSLTIDGSVTVDNGASITVGKGVTNSTTSPLGITGGTAPFLNYYDQQSHRVVIYGDFTNNGTVRFTNLAYPVYNAFPPNTLGTTSGFATVYFMGSTDNTLICNGTTDFYNLVLDKGNDQTYKLTVISSDYGNFRLFGANVAPGESSGTNPYMKKALWICTGTLWLKGSLAIPSLSEGTDGTSNPTSDYYIPASGALVLDGPNVTILSTADDYREVNVAYGVSGGSGLVNGVGQGGSSSLIVLGKLQVNDGYLSTRESGGLLYSSLNSGQIFVERGTVDTKQFRAVGSGLVSYTQNGGILQLRGRFQRTPSQYVSVSDLRDAPINTVRANEGVMDQTVGSFSLSNSSNVFSMTGGTIRIYDASGTTGRAFDVFSSVADINVSGGTLELLPTTGTVTADAANWLISSNAAVANMLVNRISGSSVVQLNTGYPLTVLKNFTIQSGVFNANNLDVTIGGDFTIESGTTYTTGTNHTIFNGTGLQTFTVNLASALSLNKLKIDQTANDTLAFAGSQKTINVADTLWIINGILKDNGNTINAATNIYNSGIHTGTGKIVLTSNTAQDIDGDGTGIFQNLELNKPSNGTVQVTATNSFTVNGTLTFSGSATGYKQLNLQSNSLSLGASAAAVGASSNRYIQTSGNLGDGGISKVYSAASTSFTFPLATSHTTENYTPATISLGSSPTTYGTITVVPVKMEHPATTTKNLSLQYFWKVRSSGFTGLPANSVTHSYIYSQDDVVSTETNYVPARYDQNTTSWTYGTTASVNTGTNTIGSPWLSNTNNIDGDYTAGNTNPTNPFGTVTTFYSMGSGRWDLIQWSNTGHSGPAVAGLPGSSNPVVISGGDSVYLRTSGTTDNRYPITIASLQIESGSVLDIGNNPASSFGVVRSHSNGNGKFRLTTRNVSSGGSRVYQFPSGDFSEFNVNGGTTEYYSTSNTYAVYYLPASVSFYGNLNLFPTGTDNIVFPNADVTVYGNITIMGTSTDSWFCPSWYDASLYHTIEKTIYVKGSLRISSGTLFYTSDNSVPQHIKVDGDVTVSSSAAIDVNYDGSPNYFGTAIVNNTMAIGGSLINNNIVNLLHNGRKCNLTFYSSNNALITNTAGTPTTTLNNVTVNKGTSQSVTLTANIGGTLTTPTDNWLSLLNGTFIYYRTGNFYISEATPFTIASTAGLKVNTSSSVYIANRNSSVNDMYLNGKLTLVNGTVYVGRSVAPNYNNDIEYSGGGSSAIEVQGGNLIVNGQIRRNPSTSSGILSYVQSGGNVVINGHNSVTTNAKLEILNSGSRFDMSGGTITIVQGGGGSTYGDLYLRPENSTVTGGEIIFTQVPDVGSGAVNADQSYLLDASVPLYNLTIKGKTTVQTRNATVNLMVNPLVLNGTLKLSNTYSIFNSNNIDVTIKGDMDNSGTYNYGTNLTTFSGNIQSVKGSSITNFYDLYVTPVTSLTFTNNSTVNHNLTINSGTLILGSKKITLLGNLTNNSSYTDDNTTGEISLSGSSLQHIAGTGSFGRLELNNNAGAKADNDITLHDNLVLTAGKLDINQYLLTLGQNSAIGGSPFSITKMIVSDGVLSSYGIRKFFGTISSPASFVFPIGVLGKYTPAIFSISSSSTVGYIRINPVNSTHPAVEDPDSVLKYYWGIESSGISGFSGNILLQYIASDVQGPESEYIAARLLTPGTEWSKATPGSATDNVDEVNHQITFNYSSTNNLNGDYTAGIDDAIPDDVPTYRSIKDGNWTDSSLWEPVGGTTPCPAGGPNGFIVIINNVVTTDANYCFAYRTTINDKLKIASPTFGHNLGTVDGSGTLYLESGNLPAGDYTSFLDCSNNGTIEYGGSGNYTIIADQYSSVPNLFFTGTGTRTLPNKDLTICNRLVIDGVTLDNNTNNRKLTILGTMERYNSGVFLSGTGSTAIVSFAGSSAQYVGGATGDFTGTNRFNILEINNSAGLTVNNNGAIEVRIGLLLTNGLINTTSTNKFTIGTFLPNCVTPSGGSASSYVNGPLIKLMASGSYFTFPVGKDSEWGHPFTITNTGASGYVYMTVEYFTPNSTYTSYLSPLKAVNASEYWGLKCSTNRTGKIDIGWDSGSDLTPLMTQNGITDMRVAKYNSSQWQELSSTATGDNSSGDVATVDDDTISTTYNYYTTASVTTTKPLATLSPTGPVCGTAGIPIKFVNYYPISLNYIIEYTIDGIAQPAITITSLPYTLPTPVAGAYQLTGFKCNNGALTGVVNDDVVNVYPIPTTANAGPDQSYCGLSGATLDANDPTPYSGMWTIVSGTGGVVLTPTDSNSVFNGSMGTTYTLRWTISSGSCTSSDDVVVAFPVAPQRPSQFTSAPVNVCQGSTGNVYTVPNISGVTFNWSYSGSGATINGTGNSVTLDFSSTATSGTLSVTATNACGTSDPRSVNITVNPMPNITLLSDDADNSFCYGSNITFTATAGLSNYNFRVDGTTVQNGTENTYSTASLTDGQTVDVVATNALGCSATSTGIINTVWDNPIANLSSSDADNKFCSGTPITFTATAGYNNYDFRVSGISQQDGTSNTFVTSALTDNQTIYVVIADVHGCTTTSSTITVTVDSLPAATAGNDGPVCAGTALSLDGGPTGMNTYSWTGPDGYSSSSRSPIVSASATVSMSGEYLLTVTDNNGCQDTASTFITVHSLPAADITPDPASVCLNDTLSLNGNPSGGSGTYTSHSWTGTGTTYLSDNAVGNPLFIASSAGTYALKYAVMDNNGCTGSDSINVTVFALPTVIITTDDADNTVCDGTMITLTASGASSYVWDNGLGAGAVQSVSPGTTTTYTVTGTDTNNCKNTQNVTITVIPVPATSPVEHLKNN